MSKKKLGAIVICILLTVLLNIYILNNSKADVSEVKLLVEVKADTVIDLNVYYDETGAFSEEKTVAYTYRDVEKIDEIEYDIKPERFLRLDFGNADANIIVLKAEIECNVEKIDVTDIIFETNNISVMNDILLLEKEDDVIKLQVSAGDPYLVVDTDKEKLFDSLFDKIQVK